MSFLAYILTAFLELVLKRLVERGGRALDHIQKNKKIEETAQAAMDEVKAADTDAERRAAARKLGDTSF